MIQMRCSSLPRIFDCHASVRSGPNKIDLTSKESSLGSAAHDWLSDMVVEGWDMVGDLFDLSRKYNVDEDELTRVCWSGLKLWREIRDSLTDVNSEVAIECQLNNVLLTGHTDLIGLMKENEEGTLTCVVVDWKTGYKERPCLPQLKGYAKASQTDPVYAGATNYLLVELRPNDPDTPKIVQMFTREEIDAFASEVESIASEKNPAFSPSETTCDYCPNRTTGCPAYADMIAGAAMPLMAILDDSSDITPARLASLWPQRCALKKAIQRYEEVLRLQLGACNGEITADGKTIRLKEEHRKELIFDAEKLRAVLPDPYAMKLTLSNKDFESAVGSYAPKGHKGRMIREAWEAVRAAGILRETTVKKIKFEGEGGSDDE